MENGVHPRRYRNRYLLVTLGTGMFGPGFVDARAALAAVGRRPIDRVTPPVNTTNPK